MRAAESEAGVYPYFEEINQSILRTIVPIAPVATPARVLDVGCGYGALGLEFRRRGYEVWGIERDPQATARASDRLDRIIRSDLADSSVVEKELGDTRFDIIVFSDVLEHMVDPQNVVSTFTRHLAPGGKVVISVPNVANWQTRLALFFGHFTYRDTGVLDRTHLRFFTRQSTLEFARTAGLDVVSVDYTPMLVRALLPTIKKIVRRSPTATPADVQAISDSRLYRSYLRFVLPLERALVRIAPGFLAFQIVITATTQDRS